MKELISLIMTFVIAAVFNIYPPTYEPLYKDTDLSFAVISDVHMEGNNNDRFKQFPKILMDISGAQYRNDALVLLGDNTMNGQFIEHSFLFMQLKLFCNALNILEAMGNHEIFTAENGYDRGSAKFKFFAGLLAGKKLDKTYYSKVINGYSFIVLGSEADKGIQAYISPEQLEWLDARLTEADASGKPAFVFCHFPLEGTVAREWTEGTIGEQSADVYNILTSHKNVFYFSGHIHNPIDSVSVGSKDGVTFIDVPCLLSSEDTGVGFQVEVHDGKVELRPRNYLTGEWLDDLAVSIDLTAQPQYVVA